MKDLNFFAPYQNEKKEKINANKYFYGAAVIVGVAIIVSLAFNVIKLFIVEKQTKNIEEKLNASEIQAELKEAENVNSQISALTKYNNAITDIAGRVKARNNLSDEVLDDISKDMPSDIKFKEIKTKANEIEIQGTAGSWDSVAEYKHNLSELKRMAGVDIKSIDTSGAVQGEYSFDIKCILREEI